MLHAGFLQQHKTNIKYKNYKAILMYCTPGFLEYIYNASHIHATKMS